jgi:hypothetical protein
MTEPCFVDCETTGLDADQHEIWEVGLIVDDNEFCWQLPVDLGRADAVALDIGGYWERRAAPVVTDAERQDAITGHRNPPLIVHHEDMPQWAERFCRLTWGRHLAGAVVSFDEERLRRLLHERNACPGWHYHIIDVEALAVGFVMGRGLPTHDDGESGIPLPWKSEVLSQWLGVDPGQFDKHTGLGDARWARALYRQVTSPG